MVDTVISTAVSTVFDFCVGATKEHLGYIWNYKKNMANLEEQVKILEEERADKSYSVTIAEKDAENITEGVKGWLEKAGNTCEETTQIINDYKEKGQQKCLMGLFPNLHSRYKLSKRACKKEAEIVGAISDAARIKKVSNRAIGLGKEIALSTKGVSPFKSRELVLEGIMKALQDETKNLIGVYGLGGMGKTTLAKQVAVRADEENMFDEIVFAPVTQAVELKKVQEKIASMLDLKPRDSTEAEIAGLIYGRLKGKKVLVILDDLWAELDLNDVGIPYGAEHMGCKILLTSRTSRVLSLMGTKKEFLLGALEEEEAWRLFEEKTIDVIKDRAFFTIGKKVAKKCAGLPVLIVTVAASLSKRPTLPAWNDALKQLKKMDNKQIHDIVNSAMKTISYNHLGEKHKELFLLCGLLGGGVSIEHLFQYSLGLDMFDGEVETMGEARDRLHVWILDLKESCLLLNSDSREDRNSIKMHDVVRDVAISIAEKDFTMLSAEGSGAKLNALQKKGVLKKCTAMVFRGDLSCLPQHLECPSLELCILSRQNAPRQYDESSFSIPNTFFEMTCNLTVLDMSELYVSTLPSSLSFLKNLQTFRADNCDRLRDISIVGELKKLQTLSLVYSGIEELPSGIGQLFELRSLDLSYCRNLRIIPAGLIAGLSRLEELKMIESFDTNVCLSELNHLPNLTSLEIAVSDAKLLSKDLSFEKLEKYEIIVGEMWSDWSFRCWLEELEITRKVCLQLGTTSINHLQHVVEKLFKRTECLCLGELNGVTNVMPELDADGFPHMKHLRIEGDDEIQYIVNMEHRQHKASFPALESLHLSYLQELQKICNGRLMEKSFYNLKVLKVENCDQLERLFSFSVAIGLRCLQEIHVSECDVLEEIVEDDGVREKIEFLQLHTLSLNCLPSLNNFFAGKMGAKSEEIASEEAEHQSSMPFFKKVSLPKLEELELCRISNLTQIWSHKLSEMHCCNLTRLTVEKCDNLQYLLTPSVSMALVGLQDLIVRGCVKMKSIVAEEEGETKMETICFPHLSYLCLEKLPNLITFYPGSVREMDPSESFGLAVQPLFNEKVKLPVLKTLRIRKLNGIKIIWPHMSRRTQNLTNWELFSFRTLQHVEVDRCQSLEYVFPAYVVGALNKLEELSIQDCGVETIIGDDNHTEFPTFTFPKLVKFNLDGLSKLKCFYPREHTSQWPALSELVVSGCDKVQPSLLPLFSIEKVAFPSSTSFKKLLEMEINRCAGLKYLFTPSIAINLEKVQKLTITECSMMKAAVSNEEGEVTTYTNMIIFPQLVYLRLANLPNLARFYSSVEEMDSNDYDAQPLFNKKIQFPRLEQLIIFCLDSINCIWQHQLYKVKEVNIINSGERHQINLKKESHEVYVAQSLKKLRVEECEKLKTIIGDGNNMEMPEEVEQGATTFVFPKLTNFELIRLQKLECFYPREHTCEWHALKVVDVCDCDKVSAFDFLSIQQGDNPLEKMISDLKTVSITQQDMIKIVRLYDGHIPQHLFQSLVWLIITEFHGEATTFPSKFLSIIHNQLQTLDVRNCSFQEIFPYEREVICKKEQYSTSIPVLDKLCTLYVTECHLLTNLVPPSVSFKSLTYLTVKDCGGLINLIHPSTATSLEHLKLLEIIRCDRIEEIIGEVKDNKEESSSFGHEIIFNKLEQLRLEDLPRLTNFSSSCSYTFNFPELRVVCMKECPNMKSFCGGVTTTPNLRSVYLNESWVELNTTIEEIYVQWEAKTLGITIPSTSSNNHFQAEAQAHENSADGVSEATMEAQTRQNATNQENVANIIDMGKGKEVEVSNEVKEHSGKSQETPCSSDHSYVAPSQHVGASFSQLRPQISNLLHEVSPLAMEGEVLTLTPSTISSNNQIEEKVQFHNDPTGVLPGPRKEGLICNNGANGDLVNEDQVCDNGTNPGKDMELCGNATEPIKGNEIGEEVAGDGKHVDIGDKAIKQLKQAATCSKDKEQNIVVSQASPDVGASSSSSQQKDIQGLHVTNHLIPLISKEEVADSCEKAREQALVACLASSQHVAASSLQLSPSVGNLSGGVKASSLATQVEAHTLAVTVSATSSNNQFEAESQFHDESPKKSTDDEPRKEGQICRNDIYENLIREVETSYGASNSLRNDVQELHVPKDFTPPLREFLQILQTQPVDNMSAEQVQFMEHAMGWFWPYLQKSRECLDRNQAISELKLEIAEREMQLQGLKEKQKALEDDNKATASSIPRFE